MNALTWLTLVQQSTTLDTVFTHVHIINTKILSSTVSTNFNSVWTLCQETIAAFFLLRSNDKVPGDHFFLCEPNACSEYPFGLCIMECLVHWSWRIYTSVLQSFNERFHEHLPEIIAPHSPTIKKSEVGTNLSMVLLETSLLISTPRGCNRIRIYHMLATFIDAC